jgi:hypothetical protein
LPEPELPVSKLPSDAARPNLAKSALNRASEHYSKPNRLLQAKFSGQKRPAHRALKQHFGGTMRKGENLILGLKLLLFSYELLSSEIF